MPEGQTNPEAQSGEEIIDPVSRTYELAEMISALTRAVMHQREISTYTQRRYEEHTQQIAGMGAAFKRPDVAQTVIVNLHKSAEEMSPTVGVNLDQLRQSVKGWQDVVARYTNPPAPIAPK